MKRLLKVLFSCVMLCGIVGLSGCTDKNETPIETIVPYSLSGAVPNEQEKIAIQFAQYIMDKNYDAAYDLMYVPADVYLNKDEFKQVEKNISTMGNTYEILTVSSNSTSVTIDFGKKIGEAYGKAKKGEQPPYLGDSIQGHNKVTIPITTEGIKPIMVGVDSSYITDEVISVHLPAGVEVWLGNKLLDDSSRDNQGYYNITNFVAGEVLELVANSEVEQGKVIRLNLQAKVGDEIADNSSMAPTSIHNGHNAYDYVWETDRVTNEEAAGVVKKSFQAIFDSIILREDFNRATFKSTVMSDKANMEAIKLAYMKCMETLTPTKNTLYTDLICVDFVPYTADECRRRQVVFEMTDTNTMIMYGTMEFTYLRYNRNDDSSSIRSGEISGQVTLTKDDGVWKLVGFDDKMLKNIA